MLDPQLKPTFWTRANLRETDKEIYIQALAAAYPGYIIEEFEYQGQCSYTLLASPLHAEPHAQALLEQLHDTLPSRPVQTNAEPWHTGNTTPSPTPYLDPSSSSSPCLIIQIRAPQHALDLSIARAAKAIYPDLAPGIRILELGDLPGSCVVYEMQRLCGVPLSTLLPRGGEVGREMQEKMGVVVEGLADVVAEGLRFTSLDLDLNLGEGASEESVQMEQGIQRGERERADSPMQPASPSPSHSQPPSPSPSRLPSLISTSIPHRLSLLQAHLPSPSLRHHAHSLLQSFTQLTQRHPPYPTVLTHGDLIPSNILVDPRTWRTTGLVDWAEAEVLPFGMCAYAVEGVLGWLEPPPPPALLAGDGSDAENVSHAGVESGVSVSDVDVDSNVLPRPKWTYNYHYHPFAPHLRALFWTRLLQRVREARASVTETELRVVRDVGVLLWYGIAWDGGRLDRVVDAVRDPGEVECLRAFLGSV